MKLTVNGLTTEIRYDRHGIEHLLAPALRAWIERTPGPGRSFAFLAAPPGTGKSTIAALVERTLTPKLQAVGLDGFHFPQAVLAKRTFTDATGATRSLASIKGAPDTFDAEALDAILTCAATQDVTWPRYDRQLHDVVADGTALTAQHVLLEGNWLLLDEPRWKAVRRHATFTCFITAPQELLRERLINRKVQGGSTREQADAFYAVSDGPNVVRTLSHTELNDVDMVLTMDAEGLIHERNI